MSAVQAPTSPRAAVREALRHLVQASGEWPFPTSLTLRNRLMDECGGDVRPLATLLLQARDHGYEDRVLALGDREAWPALHSQLTLAWVAEGFIQPDAARWAIETWAYAHDVIGSADLVDAGTRTRPEPASAPTPPRPASPPPSAPPSTGRGAPRRRGTPVRTAYTPAARSRSSTPSPAGAPMSAGAPRFHPPNRRVALQLGAVIALMISIAAVPAIRRASQPERAATPVLVPSSVAGAPLPAPREPLAGTDSAGREQGTVAPPRASGSAETSGNELNPAARIGFEIPAASGTDVPLGAPRDPGALPARGDAPGVTSLTRNALPNSRADSARLWRVRPAQRASGRSNGLAPGTIPMTGVVATLPMLDAVRLKDGTQLRGRVEVIRASTVLFRDEASGLRYELPKPDIEEILTEFGTRVRFNASGGSTTVRRGALVDRGVGGRYRVSYTVQSVTGSPTCRDLWQRPPSDDGVRVYHEPGADTLIVGFDDGDTFPSLIDRDAWFASTLRIDPRQAETSTALTTRLNGHFTDDGFTGEVHVIGYQRARRGDDTTCYSIIAMRAEKVAGG